MKDRDKSLSWQDEDAFWRRNFSTRPYTSSAPDYTVWEGGYRYGYEAANRHPDREWDDVEPELARGWDSYAHGGESRWEHIKHAVRDAWDRVSHSRAVVTK